MLNYIHNVLFLKICPRRVPGTPKQLENYGVGGGHGEITVHQSLNGQNGICHAVKKPKAHNNPDGHMRENLTFKYCKGRELVHISVNFSALLIAVLAA